MGRYSTPPEVVDEGTGIGAFGIRRVIDPDDEFATEEWLSLVHQPEVEGFEFTWREYPGESGWMATRRTVAEAVAAAYRLGYEDASGRARVPGLGS